MNNLVIDLFDKKIILNKNSCIYFNYDKLLSYPYLINNIVKFVYDKIKLLNYTHIIGIPGISSHFASILSYNHNIPLLLFNKHKIKGCNEINTNVLLIIDTIDTGNKITSYINKLISNKCVITNIFTVYKTNNNTIQFVNNYRLLSLFNEINIDKILLKQYDDYNCNSNKNSINKKIMELINKKKTKLAYDCNLTNIKDIITKVDNIGKHIIILKICSNKINNFCHNYGCALKKLALNHNFFIIDDLGLFNLNHINIDNYKWANMLTSYNNINVNFNLLYISKYISNNNIVLNNNFVGVIGSITNDYINITNTLTTTNELKNIIIENYDIITLSNSLFNEKIINYINS